MPSRIGNTIFSKFLFLFKTEMFVQLTFFNAFSNILKTTRSGPDKICSFASFIAPWIIN